MIAPPELWLLSLPHGQYSCIIVSEVRIGVLEIDNGFFFPIMTKGHDDPGEAWDIPCQSHRCGKIFPSGLANVRGVLYLCISDVSDGVGDKVLRERGLGRFFLVFRCCDFPHGLRNNRRTTEEQPKNRRRTDEEQTKRTPAIPLRILVVTSRVGSACVIRVAAHPMARTPCPEPHTGRPQMVCRHGRALGIKSFWVVHNNCFDVAL